MSKYKFPKGNIPSNFKGYKKYDHGYYRIRDLDHPFADSRGYILEHRIVWEKHNKAMLLSWATVHHKNEITDDNRIENLEAMMRIKHIQHHNTKSMNDRACFQCKSNRTYVRPNGYSQWRKHPITKQEWMCNTCYLKELRLINDRDELETATC